MLKKTLIVFVFVLLALPVVSQSVPPGICLSVLNIRPMIGQAIDKGAPIYNKGNHKGCYKIYRKTARKILKKYGRECPNITVLLGAALAKTKFFDKDDTNRAWTMRMAFDNILGVETVTG